MKKAEEWALFSLEKTQLQGDLISAPQHLQEVTEEKELGFLQECRRGEQKTTDKLKEERFQLFPMGKAWGGCVVSVLGGVQDLPGCSSEQTGLPSWQALLGAAAQTRDLLTPQPARVSLGF